jgi:hypothetical protein
MQSNAAPSLPSLIRCCATCTAVPPPLPSSPVYDSLGKALASKAAAPPQSLSRVMRPCMDSFPGKGCGTAVVLMWYRTTTTLQTAPPPC